MSADAGFANLPLLEEMYAKYLENPFSVDPKWRRYFLEIDRSEIELPKPEEIGSLVSRVPVPLPQEVLPVDSSALPSPSLSKGSSQTVRIFNLIQSYREHGHLMARVNPVQLGPLKEPRELNLEELGFASDELFRPFPTCGLMKQEEAPLQEIVDVLQGIYCGAVGIEYLGIDHPELEIWLQRQIEPSHLRIELSIEQKQLILQHLNQSELFESFLHTKYPGQKRFSLEGAETLIPMLASLVERGAELGADEFVLGMAHRGRLNVLCNLLEKSYATVFSEFEEGYIPDSFEGSGDVKYHKGFSSERETSGGKKVSIRLAPNPSHLESVDPVVQGAVYAKNLLKGDRENKRTIPVLIHGDAALSGQGVVYETLQLSKLEGYGVGGTVHLVINNQIGFTTLPQEGRSTRYCTDIAKAFNAPVFHVNAEDPESCIYVTNLALEMRQRFHCDVFIDLVCYRKYGHNETDEPAFTQPLEYRLIRRKQPIRELYRDELIRQGVLERYLAEELEEEFKKNLNKALKGIKKQPSKGKSKKSPSQTDKELFVATKTGVPLEKLREIVEAMSRIPKGFEVHRKLGQLIEHRRKMVEEKEPVDWGMAELLAYSSLLVEGISVRISGQDSCRGTFSHRHAVWVDQKKEESYCPLKELKEGQGRFEIFNSPLSEYGVLGFEYGYSITDPSSLVIWEAQFGDFANGAQILLDQYLSTGEQKWGQKSPLVLLLPHGYEGQGPEHSSARIERFLTLSGKNNLTVCYPTTPAQLFHLLRRQMKQPLERPLVIFSPKGLLRHSSCVSSIEELRGGGFSEILDDPAPPKKAKRLGFCSGKLFYDLLAEREKRKERDLALVRIEQLYPLHLERIQELIASYSEASSFFWVQEEPSNMGAWNFVRSKIARLLPEGKELGYIGRERSASPASGSSALHKREYNRMVAKIFPEEEQEEIDVNLMHRA